MPAPSDRSPPVAFLKPPFGRPFRRWVLVPPWTIWVKKPLRPSIHPSIQPPLSSLIHGRSPVDYTRPKDCGPGIAAYTGHRHLKQRRAPDENRRHQVRFHNRCRWLDSWYSGSTRGTEWHSIQHRDVFFAGSPSQNNNHPDLLGCNKVRM